uniref:Uncharacterized protein n=1 Tax=Meloidogyne hapla TaxID=6305 RepID=A0A1I8BXU9_MELHA
MPEGENLQQQNFGNKNKKEEEKTEEEDQQKMKNNFSFQKFPMPLEGGRGGGIYQSRWSNRLQLQTKSRLSRPNTPPQHNLNKSYIYHRRSLAITPSLPSKNEFSNLNQQKQPIAIFVTEFIGKFTDSIKPLNNQLIKYNDISLYFEKLLNEFNIPFHSDQEQTFCLLSAFEDNLQIFPFVFDELNNNQNNTTTISLNNSPFKKLFLIKSKQILTISRSQKEEKMFGILTNSKENIFEFFLFKTLQENLQQHSEHLKISELLNIKCRKEFFDNKNESIKTTKINCLEFTSDCSRIVANIRFLAFKNSSNNSSPSSSPTSTSPSISPLKEKIKNKIIYKFLKSIGLVNSLEINYNFDDSDETCQNTSTESIANSGDLCDPEEIFEGNCSFEGVRVFK